MAVNVSTILSVCLYCKTNSKASTEKEFHDIFDEVGLELQLPTLVEKFFHKKLINKGKQLLCEDCVNGLIELYDLEEHAKEKNAYDGAGGNETCIRAEENNKEYITKNGKALVDTQHNINPEIVGTKALKEIGVAKGREIAIPTVCEEILYDEIEVVECKNVENLPYNNKIRASNNNYRQNDERNMDQINLHIAEQEREPTNTIEDFQYDDSTDISNASEEVSPNREDEKFVVLQDNDVHYDLTIDDDSSNEYQAIETTNEIQCIQSDGQGSQIFNYSEDQELEQTRHIANLQSDEDYNERRISNQVEQYSKHDANQEIKMKNNQEVLYDLSTDDEPDSDGHLIENLANEIILEGTEIPSNDLIEEHIYEDEEESLLECISENSNDNVNNNIDLDDINEFEDDNDKVDFLVGKTKSRVENNVNEEVSKFKQYNIVEIDDSEDFILPDTQNLKEDCVIIKVIPENKSDTTMTTEEEYLIEELICSEEFDYVDLNEYFDKNVRTKFEQLELEWSVECKSCLEKYDTLQDLLKHSCINELFKNKKSGYCIFKDCEEITYNVKSLARHLILQHYEKIESLPIYSTCFDCEKNFSNFLDLNKHSCCRTIKRKAGARNFCQSCNMDFQSLKRYIFHMQFHLTKHRPKVCLLCGALFNNSDDFFNHTHYNHEPETAMACVTCDRFFKDKLVYEKHMELHDESKYTYACTFCPKKYTHKNGLTMHMDVYHNNEAKPLKCHYCDKEFGTMPSYRNHMKSHEPESDLSAFVCSECGLISCSSEILKDHIEMDKDSSCSSAMIIEEILSACYSCENCSMDFHTKQHLQKHRSTPNHSDKSFYCPICRKAFITLRHMRNHASNHKDYEQWEEMFPISRLYMCNIGNCQESYPIWSSLYYHKKRPHKNEKEELKEFKCQFCQKNCITKMSLAVHIARSHNSSNVNCSHCQRNFTNEKELQRHIDKFHIAVKCSLCDKDFKNRRNLDGHTKSVHGKEKRYFCRYCEKGYFYKSEMEYHEKNVHTEISYKCELCNFITNYPKSLEIHMNNHNNKLGFDCKICSKAFGRQQLLNVHMKRHEDEEFFCSDYCKQGCNALFFSYSRMKIHIRNVHKNSRNERNNTIKRKRSSKKSNEVVVQTADYTMLENNTKSKRRKSNTSVLMNDNDIEKDSTDLTLNEIAEEHQESENEFILD